jgi:hypothetical protein
MDTQNNKYLNNLINQILDYTISQFELKENQDKIKVKILDPIIEYLGKKLYPYILITCICLLVLLIIFFVLFILKSK